MARTFNKKNWIIGQLRRVSLRYPPAIRATNKTKEVYYILSKKGKPMKRVKFTCASCGQKDLKRSQCNLDHKVPVTSKDGFTTWDDFINGLFCDEENLWLICQPCHDVKSRDENNIRIDFRKKKKK